MSELQTEFSTSHINNDERKPQVRYTALSHPGTSISVRKGRGIIHQHCPNRQLHRTVPQRHNIKEWNQNKSDQLSSSISLSTEETPWQHPFQQSRQVSRNPEETQHSDTSNRFLQALDGSIKDIRETAYGVLAKVQAKRMKEIDNSYQTGDFVVVDAKELDWRKTKLAPYFGPFVVEQVSKADVSIRHLVTGVGGFESGSYGECQTVFL
jgi:hypothetical protein